MKPSQLPTKLTLDIMEFRIGNMIFGVVNGLFMIAGLTIIGWVIHLLVEWDTECLKLIHTPLLLLGVLMFFMSLLGLTAACFRANICLWIYISLMVLWVLALLLSAGHMYFAARSTPEKAFQYWAATKTCLIDTNVCKGTVSMDMHLEEFQLLKTRNAIQESCCKPPDYCEFEFKNGTWIVSERGVRDGNCMEWNNQEDTLCFNCDGCKETIIEVTRKDAMYMAIGLACELVLILIVCILACCGVRFRDY